VFRSRDPPRDFRAVKLRLGHPTLEADLAAVRAVRRRLPEGVALMVDFNQALSVAEAVRRGRALDAERLTWFEEPIRHDDYRGCAEVARQLATPVQLGENFSPTHAMAEALALRACDFVMPDWPGSAG
jgi:mandelate racemase